MRKKVCMFVWNHFTNDARVLRECTALSHNEYDVDLICIHDPSDENLPMYEEKNEFFKVHRVRRYPLTLQLLNKIYGFCMLNILSKFITLLIWLFSFYLFPYLTVAVSILAYLVIKTKLKVILIRTSIIGRMIQKGLSKKYDIYHSNDLNTLAQGYVCSKLRIIKKVLIYDSHEVQTSRTGYDSGIYAKLELFYISRIDSMIVENHTRAKYNEDLYGFYPNVIYNYPFKQNTSSLSKVDLHSILGVPKTEKILLYQGGIQTGRGLDKLIQASRYFKEGTLVFIGDGRIKNDLINLVSQLNLEEKVKFIPKVPLEQLPSYTANAYLGFQVLNNVCFNHYSASSNKLFEYIMSEVPVIACDFPEIKRVVETENIGLCINSHDYKDIAKAVNQLLSDVDLRNLMAKNTLRAREIYNWENEKQNLLDIYNNISTIKCTNRSTNRRRVS